MGERKGRGGRERKKTQEDERQKEREFMEELRELSGHLTKVSNERDAYKDELKGVQEHADSLTCVSPIANMVVAMNSATITCVVLLQSICYESKKNILVLPWYVSFCELRVRN